MSKNAVADSKVYFEKLDKYCLDQNIDVKNFGKERFLSADRRSVDVYAKSKIEKFIKINGQKYFFLVFYQDDRFIVTYGTSNDIDLDFALSVDFLPGDLMLVCLGGDIAPSASPEVVSDFLGAGERGMPGYGGHDFDTALNNYGRFQKFSVDSDVELSFDKICYQMALKDLYQHKGWMEKALLDDLMSLGELNLSLPYRNLLRSLYDIDPAGIFLSLYRCIEATYAFKVCSELVYSMGIEIGWVDLFEILNSKANWRPKELESLESVLSMGSYEDHKNIIKSSSKNGSVSSKKAAEIVYEIRNRLVHFRPYQNLEDIYLGFDWNLLCRAMIGQICFIYSEINSKSSYILRE